MNKLVSRCAAGTSPTSGKQAPALAATRPGSHAASRQIPGQSQTDDQVTGRVPRQMAEQAPSKPMTKTLGRD